MAYMERGTMTGQALRYLIDNSFSLTQGARPGVTKVGIVFTDGRSQDYIGDAAKKAKEMGKRVDFFLLLGCRIIKYSALCLYYLLLFLYHRFKDVCCWSGQCSGG